MLLDHARICTLAPVANFSQTALRFCCYFGLPDQFALPSLVITDAALSELNLDSDCFL